ncbi:lipase 3-like [Contarinia nasturtii]|uniref:lipase 3-like n=1 Tax=Contarinia nasturtii TaxID=265458 RepID=UPI0012D3D9A4|nr:lipase 3-like [Contarinia nasturtii]
MFHAKIERFISICDILIVCQIVVIQSKFNLKSVDFLKTFQDPLTRKLCKLRTNELIEYNGYRAEEHNVITEDGYNLTIFRCNSKNRSPDKDKVVVLHHGLLASSDDYCMNVPSQSLAYILADAGYDVFLSNSRGNSYSRSHITLTPNDKRFWNFSWYVIAIYDYPAVFDYVIKETKQTKVNVVAFSMGTTSMMTLLSDRPEYNDYVRAASLMAPVGYIKYAGAFYQTLESFHKFLVRFSNTELLPKGILTELFATFCGASFQPLCEKLSYIIFGPSQGQVNHTMMANFFCHLPSGTSLNQILHYGSEIRHNYFGEYMRGSTVPPDFNLSQIRAPISLHYSPNDILGDPKDVAKLIPKLNNCLARVQFVNQTKFNHYDFIWGIQAAELVYSNIMSFFNEHQ